MTGRSVRPGGVAEADRSLTARAVSRLRVGAGFRSILSSAAPTSEAMR